MGASMVSDAAVVRVLSLVASGALVDADAAAYDSTKSGITRTEHIP